MKGEWLVGTVSSQHLGRWEQEGPDFKVTLYPHSELETSLGQKILTQTQNQTSRKTDLEAGEMAQCPEF